MPMKPANHLVDCGSCKGAGKVAMNEELRSVLRCFHSSAWKFTAHQVWEKLAPTALSVNAINNRLERLRKFGFLVREQCGRAWKYQLAPKS